MGYRLTKADVLAGSTNSTVMLWLASIGWPSAQSYVSVDAIRPTKLTPPCVRLSRRVSFNVAAQLTITSKDRHFDP
jgi:hypothetical protein